MNENATYKQLMLLPSDELTDGQKTFLAVHNEMVMAGQKAADCLLIMLNDLRRMRDEKLYTVAGFESFIDYVEAALNVKERQARYWAKLLDLPEAYLTENAGMGVSKLIAIASASDKVAEELMSDETVPDKTVKELNAMIKEREELIESQNKQMVIMVGEIKELRQKETDLELLQGEEERHRKAEEVLSNQLKEAHKTIDEANAKIKESEAKVKELKNKKPKVVTETVEKTVEVENPETKKALEQAQKDAEAAKEAKANAEAAAEQYQKELAAYKKTQEAIAAFKIHASSLFEAWDTVIEAVKQIKAVDADYAAKCVAKLTAFNETVKSDIEEVQG